MTEGWAFGSEEFKAGLLKDHTVAALARAWEDIGAREIRTASWEEQCQQALAVLGRSDLELKQTPGRVQ